MISKPREYDESRIAGDFERLPAGGYVCKILGAQAENYKNAPRLILQLDIAEGKFRDYYKEQQQAFNSPNWGCLFRQNIEGKSLPFFKGLITSIDESNQGFKSFQGEMLDERRLVGRYIGFIFGEEEYIAKDGKLKTSVKPQTPHSAAKIRNGDWSIPEVKKLSGGQSAPGSWQPLTGNSNSQNAASRQQGFDGFYGFEELNDAQLPF